MSVCRLSPICTLPIRSSAQPHSVFKKKERKKKPTSPLQNILERIRKFPASPKKKMEQHPHFLSTHTPAILSGPCPPWLFFHVPSEHTSTSPPSAPQSLHLASIMHLLARFVLTLRTLIKVNLSNECNLLQRGALIKKKKKSPLIIVRKQARRGKDIFSTKQPPFAW